MLQSREFNYHVYVVPYVALLLAPGLEGLQRMKPSRAILIRLLLVAIPVALLAANKLSELGLKAQVKAGETAFRTWVERSRCSTRKSMTSSWVFKLSS